ncbi:MAG: tetratricopeptide repeat protein [Pseudomonadota bacterium]
MRILTILIALSALLASSCTLEPKTKIDSRAELAKLSGPEVGTIENNLKKQADSALSNGDFKRASQTYRQIADLHPEKPEYRIALADSLRRSGAAEAGLKEINEQLVKTPDNAEALEVKGLCLMSLGEFAESGKILDKALSIDGKRWRTLNAIGIMFAIKQMNPQAIEYYNAALKSNPNNAGVLNNLALSLAMQNDYEGAIEKFNLARSSLPQNSAELEKIDLNLALVYAISGRLDEAEKTADPHLTKAGLYNNMGFYAYINKNKELSKTYLNMALNQNPVYYDRAWKNLSAVSGENSSELNATENDKQTGILNKKAKTIKVPDFVEQPKPEVKKAAAEVAISPKPEIKPEEKKSEPVKAEIQPVKSDKVEKPKPIFDNSNNMFNQPAVNNGEASPEKK